jgi:hypothetical protein
VAELTLEFIGNIAEGGGPAGTELSGRPPPMTWFSMPTWPSPQRG